ncbi:autophagy protein Apg16, putative [Aspergillus udagawae]|uniref:Autophagy protein Apg16, putative n=1 Tax=Aspergillus udagawae TaxID=91492 RepID=A0ABQ1BE97_9EURO|nr:autophagy protein Apg16, putative [Aspergillus udagawae]GFF99807.1 autophagy protein Apg16, putative [Aspergillus udagawae]GFG19177.1 autophagy protein Apg16, putative [Aspergillus udagawae]GFG20932.1 autophagy protein Apg16, putative [Aspergillus udagawae]
MAHWRNEYSAALAARDRREKANIVLYNAYTQLADRTSRIAFAGTQGAQYLTGAGDKHTAIPATGKSLTGPSVPDILAATRADLSEAQRARSELQARLTELSTELEKLRKRSTQDGRRIHTLEREVTHLQMRVKDRDEELKGKAKLLEDFQDELATLNLQLNMAEERSGRLQRENQELIDRWMARIGREAEAMNDASTFS